MNFSQHAKAGLISATIAGIGYYTFANDLKTAVMSAALVFIGSVFPDLDTESIPSRWAARIGFIFSLLCIATNKLLPAAIIGALFFLIKSGKHRGFTHKYSLPALCITAWFFLGNVPCAAFGVGLLVHFGLDKISPFQWKNWL